MMVIAALAAMPAFALNQSFNTAFLLNPRSVILNGPSIPLLLTVPPSPHHTRMRCSYKEDFQTLDQMSAPFTPSELRLPLGRQSSEEAEASDEEGKPKEANTGTVDPVMASTKNETVADVLNAAIKAMEGLTVAQLALYGGVTVAGLFILESILTSLEGVPLFPEALQLIGVLYTILLASRIFQGKSVNLTPSPVKAIMELVENGDSKFQRTNLPQDLDIQVLATIEKIAKERDEAVNEMEDLRRMADKYARVVVEKEAVEAVAMQLAKERDEALSEVTALKQAVDAMSDRMRSIEKVLQQELEPLKQSTIALETVALQLASERDSALKELSELKEVVARAKLSEEEKIALQSLASQLAEERDQALSENKKLEKILEEIQTARAPVAGLSPEKESFLKASIGAAGSPYIDLDKQYDDQKEQVDKFVSHLVDVYGAPPGWTAEYVKQFLDFSASKTKTVEKVTFSSSQPETEQPC